MEQLLLLFHVFHDIQDVSQCIEPIPTFLYLEWKVTETKTKQLWKLENIKILKNNSSIHLHELSLYLQHIIKCAQNVPLSAGDRLGDGVQSCQSL